MKRVTFVCVIVSCVVCLVIGLVVGFGVGVGELYKPYQAGFNAVGVP